MCAECQVTDSGASCSAHHQQPKQQAWHPSLDWTQDSRPRIWAGLGPPEALLHGMQMAGPARLRPDLLFTPGPLLHCTGVLSPNPVTCPQPEGQG